ncbi:unnamed protein product [Peronospora belbahrii]|uniref:Uncharacterized protein n=1 Tax=Peronospora belbahrii TaxID=622444 RepID=A0ABN8D9U5_9STRA|nr:unnamed protein product [Peronospora belbahrii]
MTDKPLSPLGTGSSDDLLTVLDEIPGLTPDAAVSMDSVSPDSSYIADAFEFAKVPNLYEHESVDDLQPVVLEMKKVQQTTDLSSIVIEQPLLQQKEQQQIAQRGKDARTMPYPKAKPPRRTRTKEEIDYLRAMVADMERELATLSRSSRDGRKMFPRWKLIAERQKEEASKTIVENRKLRAILKSQIEIAKRRERIMRIITDHHQHVASQALPLSFIKTEFDFDIGNNNDARRPRAPSVSDETIFAELNRGLAVQYAQVDARFEASGIADLNREQLGKIQLKHDMNGIAFGMKEVRIMPFTMQTSARVMWSFVMYESGKTCGVQTRVINNDHLNATIVNEIQLPKSQHTKVTSRIAVRRYSEGSRVVIVWSGFVEIAGSVFVRLREQGFVTISPFDFTGSESSSLRPGGSIARIVADIKPEAVEFSTEANTIGNFELMIDLVIEAYRCTLENFSQAMENLLLQDLMDPST